MESSKTGKTIVTRSDGSFEESISQYDQSSVKIEVNSKGRVQFEVKVYGKNAEQAANEAIIVYDELTRHFENKLPDKL